MMNLIKQSGVFDPFPYHNEVAIIGIGALGSALALQLAKLGIEKLHLFDDDVVEEHNLSNQLLYGVKDVGRSKSVAACERLLELTGNEHYSFDRLSKKNYLNLSHSTVFVCVDSMSERKNIWHNFVFGNPRITLFGEGRMGVREIAAYLFDPQNFSAWKAYQETLYSDDDVVVEKAACGTHLSIGATANALACALTWMLISHSHRKLTQNELLFKCEPWGNIAARSFGDY